MNEKRVKKIEKVYAVLVLLFFVVAISYGEWKDRKIDEDFVYTIGKVYAINDTENDKNYDFKYFIDNKEYKAGIKDLYFPMQDSMILLKVSRTNPKLCKRLTDKILECFLDERFLYTNWREYPLCPSE
jgi:hypothetical protein